LNAKAYISMIIKHISRQSDEWGNPAQSNSWRNYYGYNLRNINDVSK